MRLLVLLAATAIIGLAADWLSAWADPKHTRSQPAETELSRETIGDLKLLWKMRFDEPVTAPVVLGPIYTHRGIKELVFVGGAGDNLYAVDADLARLVWKRHFDSVASGKLTAAPVLSPYYGPAPEGDDASTPRRSLFVVTGDGQLHTVRPADGHDLSLPLEFVPPASTPSDLTLTSSVISTDFGSKTWSIRLDGGHEVTRRESLPEAKAATSSGYRVLATSNSLTASREGKTVWSMQLTSAIAPLIANRLVYTVSGSMLWVFDLQTGRTLFKSEPNGDEPAAASMALANGHVYFIAGQTIYCYGFPLEI